MVVGGSSGVCDSALEQQDGGMKVYHLIVEGAIHQEADVRLLHHLNRVLRLVCGRQII